MRGAENTTNNQLNESTPAPAAANSTTYDGGDREATMAMAMDCDEGGCPFEIRPAKHKKDQDHGKPHHHHGKEHFVGGADGGSGGMMGALMNLDKQYIDLAIYIFSGIVLIFAMEQFVQIGMALRG